jgi:hypothetical protein
MWAVLDEAILRRQVRKAASSARAGRSTLAMTRSGRRELRQEQICAQDGVRSSVTGPRMACVSFEDNYSRFVILEHVIGDHSSRI